MSDKEIEQYSEEFKNILFAKPKPDDNDELRMLKIINSNLEKINTKLWLIKFGFALLLGYVFLKFGW